MTAERIGARVFLVAFDMATKLHQHPVVLLCADRSGELIEAGERFTVPAWGIVAAERFVVAVGMRIETHWERRRVEFLDVDAWVTPLI